MFRSRFKRCWSPSNFWVRICNNVTNLPRKNFPFSAIWSGLVFVYFVSSQQCRCFSKPASTYLWHRRLQCNNFWLLSPWSGQLIMAAFAVFSTQRARALKLFNNCRGSLYPHPMYETEISVKNWQINKLSFSMTVVWSRKLQSSIFCMNVCQQKQKRILSTLFLPKTD